MEGVCGGMSAQCLHLLSTFFIVVVFLVEKVTDRLVVAQLSTCIQLRISNLNHSTAV